ncbi:MAG: hypothetical protein BYD32DRAFT_471651 [Podila humilis]|nr:MAG: hypothetical protein BYD32DRAFT_471651 [Podila humilis]
MRIEPDLVPVEVTVGCQWLRVLMGMCSKSGEQTGESEYQFNYGQQVVLAFAGAEQVAVGSSTWSGSGDIPGATIRFGYASSLGNSPSAKSAKKVFKSIHSSTYSSCTTAVDEYSPSIKEKYCTRSRQARDFLCHCTTPPGLHGEDAVEVVDAFQNGVLLQSTPSWQLYMSGDVQMLLADGHGEDIKSIKDVVDSIGPWS